MLVATGTRNIQSRLKCKATLELSHHGLMGTASLLGAETPPKPALTLDFLRTEAGSSHERLPAPAERSRCAPLVPFSMPRLRRGLGEDARRREATPHGEPCGWWCRACITSGWSNVRSSVGNSANASSVATCSDSGGICRQTFDRRVNREARGVKAWLLQVH